MDDQRYTAAMSDADLDRELVQALAVEPSPAFVARVRTRIASEPAPRSVLVPWRVVAVAAAAAVIVAAVLVTRSERVETPVATTTLAARTIASAASVPNIESDFQRQYGESAFRRTAASRAEAGLPVRASLSTARGEPVEPRASGPAEAGPYVLLDPRETRALRSLLAGVRDNRVDLTPLRQTSTPAAMDLPPVENLVIAPIAIDPLDPISRSSQGERQ